MKLESLLQYMDGYLGTGSHPDYPTALNGLQVAGPDEVRRVVTAVDASQASIDAAVDADAHLLMVHHGLFWGGLQPIVGPLHRRVSALLRGGVALYSCHLPLDGHAEVGNCVLLARALGLSLEGRLGAYGGTPLGWWGRLDAPLEPSALAERVAQVTGSGRVDVLSGGPATIETVGVVTGGAASFTQEAAALGLDAFVTGEGSHHTFFDAAEFRIHVLLAGHYATETFGIRALGEHIGERFGLDVSFVDQPTGL